MFLAKSDLQCVIPETSIFVLRKERSKTKKKMKEEETEKGDCGLPTRSLFFFEILSDFNQMVPNHLLKLRQV